MIKAFTVAGVSLLLSCLAVRVDAQVSRHVHQVPIPVSDSVRVTKDSVPQKDLSDVLHNILHHNQPPKVKSDSITSKPVFSYIPAIGYTLTTGLALTLSGNIEFRLAPDARVSTITASAAFTSKAQFTLPIESNIWSKNGEYVFIGDYRFYKYPQSTYGLGSSSNIINEDPVTYNYIRFYETILRKISGSLFLGGGYIVDYHGDIDEKGNTNGSPSSYDSYPSKTSTISSGFTINGLFDARNNTISPSGGGYAAFQFRDSYQAIGSTYSWSSLIVDLRKYYNFPEGSKNVLALWSYDWLVLSGHPPYFDLPSTSWDPYSSTGRGYIQGRFRGAQMVYFESEYRFNLSANGLFGGVLFANAESFSAAQGTRLQAFQPGFGTGLRIKLNKVSKTNVCIDYGFGREGSRGLFVNVGELF